MRELPAVLVFASAAPGRPRRRGVTPSTFRLDRPEVALAVAADPDVALAQFDGPLRSTNGSWCPRSSAPSSAPSTKVPLPVASSSPGEPGGSDRGRLASHRESCAARADADVSASWRAAPQTPDRCSECSSARWRVRAPHIQRSTSPVQVERALRGGLPGATVAASEAGRQRWLAGYVDQLVARDVPLAGGRRDPVRLRRYLRSIAANLAGEVELKSLIDATNLDRSTALAYDDVLEHLLITERLPAWSTNRLATNASPSRRSRRSGAADRSPSRPPRQ